MKIAHISIYPELNKKHTNLGGVSSYTKNLVMSMPYKKDDRVYVLCNKINSKYEKYKDSNIHIIRCFDKNYKFIFQLSKVIKDLKPDVIHIQQELSLFGNPFTAYLLQWFLFIHRQYSIVITLHGIVSLKEINRKFIKENGYSLPKWLVKLSFVIIYKPLALWVKAVIVHEDYLKKVFIEEYGVTKEKIYVINHGIEDLKPVAMNIAKKKIGLNNKKGVVLFMGYLTGYKGIDLLIDGFSIYAKKNKNAFLIIGAGKHPRLKNSKKYLSEYYRLYDKAQNSISPNQYRWVGFIPEEELKYYYCAADVSVYPYVFFMASSGPMALAIGYRKPLILNNVFQGTSDDMLVFSNTANDLSKALIKIFMNRNKYKRATDKLRRERLWPVIGNKTYRLYVSL